MLIIKGKKFGGYYPEHDIDLPMFKHCCDGFMEVKDIHKYIPIFAAHAIDIMIQDETL